MNRTLLPLLVAATLATPAGAVPRQLGLTARVIDAGNPISGSHQVTVRLFAAATGGNSIWNENQTVTATDGMVFVTLGTQTTLTDSIIDGNALWAEVQVDATVLSPRLELTSAAYAIRAAVAENAQQLGGQPASAFALSSHSHNYLPLSSTRTCPGTQKVIGLDVNGAVMCGADLDTATTYTAGAGLTSTGTTFDVAFGGSGLSTSASRADHNHTGTYLPVGATLSCTGTQKMTGVAANGSVVCGADTDTTYLAGTGLSVTANTFSVSFAGTGTAVSAARSDHSHAASSCPAGFGAASRTAGGVTTLLCLRAVAGASNWVVASRGCQNSYAASLCSFEDIIHYRGVFPAFGLTADYWLADRVGDNLAISTNASGALDDFDVPTLVTDLKAGAYCCLQRTWW